MTTTYLERLATRSSAVRSVLCLGIDPDPAGLPPGFGPTAAGIEAFATLLVDAAGPHAAAVKPNIAFFEAFGSAGIAALERVRARIPSDLPVVLDAKRADIGTTAARQAVALFDALGADAVTINPYLGEEAIAPFLERADRFAYVLCRTSNPGAGELQDLRVGAEGAAQKPRAGETAALWAHVARRVATWGPGGTVGLVVGATAPEELREVRRLAPGLAFLVPGVGVQGGDVDAVLEAGPATASPAGEGRGGGLLVNISRGIAQAASGAAPGPSREGVEDPAERLAEAAAAWAGRLPVLP